MCRGKCNKSSSRCMCDYKDKISQLQTDILNVYASRTLSSLAFDTDTSILTVGFTDGSIRTTSIPTTGTGGSSDVYTLEEDTGTGLINLLRNGTIVSQINLNNYLQDTGLQEFSSIALATSTLGVGVKFRYSQTNSDGVPSPSGSSIGITQ